MAQVVVAAILVVLSVAPLVIPAEVVQQQKIALVLDEENPEKSASV